MSEVYTNEVIEIEYNTEEILNCMIKEEVEKEEEIE